VNGDDDGTSVWQVPDPDGAEERVRGLEQIAATLRGRPEASAELEQVENALAVARIDLAAHRTQRRARDQERALRRSDAVLQQRREVVALFEETERRLLDRQAAGDDAVGDRLDATRLDLQLARAELARADAERRSGADA
jgi:hypothetical protein